MHEHAEPPGKAGRLPHPPQCARRILVEQPLAARPIELHQCAVKHPHVGGGEIQTLGAGGRHDVCRVADEKQAAESHRFGNETAQRGDAFLDGRTRNQVRGDAVRQTGAQFIPKLRIGPIRRPLRRRALNVIAAAGRGAHSAEGEAARMIRVDQFVPHRRHVGEYAQPAEWIRALMQPDSVRRHAAAADAVIAIAARDEVALDDLPLTVPQVADAWLLAVEILDRDLGRLVDHRPTARLPGLAQIPLDFRLPVDRDS